jgi:hypothetical protein
VKQKILAKEIALLSSLKKNLGFTAWEPSLGGKFPRATFNALIVDLEK